LTFLLLLAGFVLGAAAMLALGAWAGPRLSQDYEGDLLETTQNGVAK
jgi:hypothetical protein